MSENRKLKVFRYDESMKGPKYCTYEVPQEKGQSVLQALFWIKEVDDDPPAFRRYQCNRGQCCSCLMTINGEIKRACTTEVKGDMVIEPLQDYPVIRDLIVDFGRLVDGKLIRKGTMIQWPKAIWEAKRAMKQFIAFHEEKCTSCELCQKVCPVNLPQNLNSKFGERIIQPILFRRENGGIDLAGVCSQCTHAPCMHFCPTKVISRDKKTGAICIDRDNCIGCVMCLIACPNDAIFLDMERGKAVKCELCGGHPLCVESCPTGALQFGSYRNEEE